MFNWAFLCTDVLSQDSTATVTPTIFPSEVCGGPGWNRVAFINMTDLNQNCPRELSQTNYSIRSCGRAHSSYGCSSLIFPVNGLQYSRVCGRATAYRWGVNNAFYGYHSQGQPIDEWYVDGLSLTHGSPRTHIWTFASGRYNGTTGNADPNYRCPCDPGNTFDSSPPFVGNDYFCDSTVTASNWDLHPPQFYSDNALWDGQDLLNPCYGLNNPPWFFKTLSVSTTDDIELRLCMRESDVESNIAVELFEMYIN